MQIYPCANYAKQKKYVAMKTSGIVCIQLMWMLTYVDISLTDIHSQTADWTDSPVPFDAAHGSVVPHTPPQTSHILSVLAGVRGVQKQHSLCLI